MNFIRLTPEEFDQLQMRWLEEHGREEATKQKEILSMFLRWLSSENIKEQLKYNKRVDGSLEYWMYLTFETEEKATWFRLRYL